MSSPLVSVVMTVYNAEKYLKEAIVSILEQTYKNFEFIIIDDGSTDNSATIVKSYDDPRIIFRSRGNKGQTASLNEGIELAKGEYIARQDADDISAKNRFQKQVEFMEHNPSVGLLGTNHEVVYENGNHWFTTNFFTRPDDLKVALIFANQLGHGTVMMRRQALLKSGLYDESFRITQDYDLWNRMSHVCSVANLKEPLYIWRYYQGSLSTGNADETQEEVWKVRDREFKYFMKHKSKFKLTSIHPSSTTLGFKKYCEMKNIMYRNMALMYCYKEKWASASFVACLAAIYAPWRMVSYRYLFTILISKKLVSSLKYD